VKRPFVSLFVCAALAWACTGPALAHCEIPCGIYDDSMRIDMLREHIATVEKSMRQIEILSKDPVKNANQLTRWINNKEKHCNEIQQIVTQYFMTQRIKPAPASDAEARDKYVAQLTSLHAMLIEAMKAKQTTDLAHTTELGELVVRFSKLYFSESELEHLMQHRD
jgi:nickel superoxide dismutase